MGEFKAIILEGNILTGEVYLFIFECVLLTDDLKNKIIRSNFTALPKLIVLKLPETFRKRNLDFSLNTAPKKSGKYTDVELVDR